MKLLYDISGRRLVEKIIGAYCDCKRYLLKNHNVIGEKNIGLVEVELKLKLYARMAEYLGLYNLRSICTTSCWSDQEDSLRLLSSPPWRRLLRHNFCRKYLVMIFLASSFNMITSLSGLYTRTAKTRNKLVHATLLMRALKKSGVYDYTIAWLDIEIEDSLCKAKGTDDYNESDNAAAQDDWKDTSERRTQWFLMNGGLSHRCMISICCHN